MIEGRPATEILHQRMQLRNYGLALRGYLENIKQYEDASEDSVPDIKKDQKVQKYVPSYMAQKDGARLNADARVAPKAKAKGIIKRPARLAPKRGDKP